MGSSLSHEQQKFCNDLFHLLTENGHSVTKKEVENLIWAIDEVCPWMPAYGTFDLEKWTKIGTSFQSNPKVHSRVLFTWCKVRACLKDLTPNNILFNQHLECGGGQLPPLPQILPPLPSVPPPPNEQEWLLPRKPPDRDKQDNEDSNPLDFFSTDIQHGGVTSTVSVPVSQNFSATLAAALMDSGDAGNDMISAFPIIRGPPAADGAPGPARYESLSYQMLKELQRSAKENGIHAPYTKALLENLSEQRLTPADWKLLIRSLWPPAQALLCIEEWKHLATEQHEKNARANPVIPITRDMLIGEGNFTTIQQQTALTDQALTQTGQLVQKAWRKIPGTGAESVSTFAGIHQGAKEPYVDFVNRLLTALDRQVESFKARTMLSKQLAFENANQECKQALASIYGKADTTIQDMLKVCQNIGSHAHKAQLFAAAVQVAANPAAGKKCFACGKEGHFRANCRSAPKEGARPTRKCPLCNKGFHWANQCRSRPNNQGNAKTGQPQAQEKN